MLSVKLCFHVVITKFNIERGNSHLNILILMIEISFANIFFQFVEVVLFKSVHFIYVNIVVYHFTKLILGNFPNMSETIHSQITTIITKKEVLLLSKLFYCITTQAQVKMFRLQF